MRNNKGITLVALMVTIILMLIIAGIAINEGKDTIEKANLEELRTNLLLIQAKARECVEEANFKMGINPSDEKINTVREEIYEKRENLEIVESLPVCVKLKDANNVVYRLTTATFQNWKLDKIVINKNEEYLIEFDEEHAKVADVYSTLGYDGKYSLSELEPESELDKTE